MQKLIQIRVPEEIQMRVPEENEMHGHNLCIFVNAPVTHQLLQFIDELLSLNGKVHDNGIYFKLVSVHPSFVQDTAGTIARPFSGPKFIQWFLLSAVCHLTFQPEKSGSTKSWGATIWYTFNDKKNKSRGKRRGKTAIQI